MMLVRINQKGKILEDVIHAVILEDHLSIGTIEIRIGDMSLEISRDTIQLTDLEADLTENLKIGHLLDLIANPMIGHHQGTTEDRLTGRLRDLTGARTVGHPLDLIESLMTDLLALIVETYRELHGLLMTPIDLETMMTGLLEIAIRRRIKVV